MFMTTPELEHRLPEIAGVGDHRFWTAVLLSNESPWFLLTYSIRDDGGRAISQSIAVAWESALLDVLNSFDATHLVSLRVLNQKNGAPGDWVADRVTELWLSGPHESSHCGPLLFHFEGAATVCNAFRQRPHGSAQGRELLHRFVQHVR